MNELVLTIIILVTWPSLLYRLYKGFYHHHEKPYEAGGTSVTYRMWPPAITMALAGTAYHPAIIDYLDQTVWHGFGLVPCNTLAMLAIFMASRICLDFIPGHMHPRWQWHQSVALLTMVNFVAWSGMENSLQASLIANIIFSFALLILVARLIVPALSWVILLEKVVATQLRIQALRGMFIFVMIWMVNDVGLNLLLLAKLPPPYSIYSAINSITIAGVGLLFCLSFFVAQRTFEQLTYFHHIVTCVLIRLLELGIYAWLLSKGNRDTKQSKSTSLRILIRSPSHMTYRSVIAILDVSKMLRIDAQGWIYYLSQRLQLVMRPHIGYDEVVNRLRSIALEFLPMLIVAHLYFACQIRLNLYIRKIRVH